MVSAESRAQSGLSRKLGSGGGVGTVCQIPEALAGRPFWEVQGQGDAGSARGSRLQEEGGS